MATVLLILLFIVDLILIGVIYFLSQRPLPNAEMLSDVSEERRMLTEMRESIQQEMELALSQIRKIQDRTIHVAAEAEREVKTGTETIASQMESIVKELSTRFDAPLTQLARKHASVEALLRKVDKEKLAMNKAIARAEKICKFFDKNLPYEDLLSEIEDKKYVDARSLLAQGFKPEEVASQLNLPTSEVRLLADFA